MLGSGLIPVLTPPVDIPWLLMAAEQSMSERVGFASSGQGT